MAPAVRAVVQLHIRCQKRIKHCTHVIIAILIVTRGVIAQNASFGIRGSELLQIPNVQARKLLLELFLRMTVQFARQSVSARIVHSSEVGDEMVPSVHVKSPAHDLRAHGVIHKQRVAMVRLEVDLVSLHDITKLFKEKL
jgi:hypothetical protein